eukprot:4896222-Amphidinium_carterae.1
MLRHHPSAEQPRDTLDQYRELHTRPDVSLAMALLLGKRLCTSKCFHMSIATVTREVEAFDPIEGKWAVRISISTVCVHGQDCLGQEMLFAGIAVLGSESLSWSVAFNRKCSSDYRNELCLIEASAA